MNEHIQTLVFSGFSFALGMAVGQFVSFRRKAGKKIVVEIEAREVWERIIKEVAWIVVIVVFLASIAQSVIFTYDQRTCNQQVVETLKFRATVAAEIGVINDQRDHALREFLDTVLTSGQTPDPQKTARDAFAKHAEVTAQLNQDAAAKNKLRDEATFPDCGS